MIEISFKARIRHRLYRSAVREATMERLTKFAERVKTYAVKSMKWSKYWEPSRVGTPPHRQTGTLAKAVIVVTNMRRRVVQVGIDTTSPAVKYWVVHEYGLRPFLYPAWKAVVKRSGNILRGLNISNTKAAGQLKAKRR